MLTYWQIYLLRLVSCVVSFPLVLFIPMSGSAFAATPGLPFTEDFSSTALRDAIQTTANWSTEQQALLLAWKKAQYGAFGSANTTGSDITLDAHDTYAIALGDVDGDGDLDLVAGNRGSTNRLYINNGTSNPFTAMAGVPITTDAHDTYAVALGDMDGDGDLDLVAGNSYQPSRLYLNNGTSNPFAGVIGSNITSDTFDTRSVVLGDVDDDGDLDLVTGNNSQPNRLYLNNGTSDPFAGVTGIDVTANAYGTQDIKLGDMDGDGDLDLVVGNYGQVNRLYLNNGTDSPFAGVTGSDITSDTRSTTGIALGDVDGDGDLDLVVGNNGDMNRLYLNNGTSDPFAGVTGSDITSDAHFTNSITLGDLDGDGDLDLIVGNYGQPSRLYRNNGTSDPFARVSGSSITTDIYGTQAVAVGDMDGDGDLDIVAGNSGGRNRLYLNNCTSNPWTGTSGTNISSDAYDVNSIALGDVDGDGDLDLVTGNNDQHNRLYLNNGTSNPFSGVTGSDITTDVGITRDVALGDMDGDGDLDLVVGNYGQANRLYLNNGTGDPFADVIGSNITSDVQATTAVALSDVDGDGDLDILVGNFNQRNRLYLNNGTSNPFAGVTGSDITTDTYSTVAVIAGDVDQDGDLDLVVGNYGQVNRLYLNNGTSDPFAGVTGSNITSDAHNTQDVMLADVDGDGDPDLVVANNGQANRLYLNNGTSNPFTGVTGSNITSDARATYAVALGDVDADGDLDLMTGNNGQTNRLYLNNGTGNPFAGVTGSDITSDAHATTALALADVDGDGDLDLVAGNGGQASRLYRSSAAPLQPWNTNTVTGSDITSDERKTTSLALGDVDGDGDLDLVAGNDGMANRLYLNNDTSDPFAGVTGSDITADVRSTYAIALGDVDRDGDLDLVAGNWGTANRLYRNNGTSDPFAGVTGSDITSDAHNTTSVALGDVDGDGDLDLVVGNYNQTNRLYLNNGTTSPWTGVTGRNITADVYGTYAVVLGDVDGDGDLDLVVGNSGQTNRLYLNNGTSDPWNGVTGSDITSDADATMSIVLGDVDGDGDLDLVAGNNGQPNRLYLNNGTSDPWSDAVGSNISFSAHNTYATALGDIDGDGDLDLVAGNNGGANRLYLNNGTSNPFSGVTGSNITSDAHSTWEVLLGDVDGDGDMDIVAGNYLQANRLYRLQHGYHTAQGLATSLRVDDETGDIGAVTLTASGTLPQNTGIRFWLSNNGGAHWFLAKSGAPLLFPTTGRDLRWRAKLWSLSPRLSPMLDEIGISLIPTGEGEGEPDEGEIEAEEPPGEGGEEALLDEGEPEIPPGEGEAERESGRDGEREREVEEPPAEGEEEFELPPPITFRYQVVMYPLQAPSTTQGEETEPNDTPHAAGVVVWDCSSATDSAYQLSGSLTEGQDLVDYYRLLMNFPSEVTEPQVSVLVDAADTDLLVTLFEVGIAEPIVQRVARVGEQQVIMIPPQGEFSLALQVNTETESEGEGEVEVEGEDVIPPVDGEEELEQEEAGPDPTPDGEGEAENEGEEEREREEEIQGPTPTPTPSPAACPLAGVTASTALAAQLDRLRDWRDGLLESKIGEMIAAAYYSRNR